MLVRDRGVRIVPPSMPELRASLGRRGAAFVLLVVLAMLSSVAGCSDPDAAILARMNEVDEARFRSGRQVAVPCWTCHDLKGTVKKVGPSLKGLYGRQSGQAPDYEASSAMASASIVWDDRLPVGLPQQSRRFRSRQPNGLTGRTEPDCAPKFALLSSAGNGVRCAHGAGAVETTFCGPASRDPALRV